MGKGPEANSAEIKSIVIVSLQTLVPVNNEQLDGVSPAPEVVNKPGDHVVCPCAAGPTVLVKP